jgi:phosphopantetheine--protein transferase-like protein
VLQGIGIDLIETDRFQTLENKETFLAATFTPEEIEQAKQNPNPNIYWPEEFVCKEATLKACSIGLYYGSFWHDIVLSSTDSVTVTGRVKTHLKPAGMIKITCAHSRRYAIGCAFVHNQREVV